MNIIPYPLTQSLFPLRFLIEDAALYLSDKNTHQSQNSKVHLDRGEWVIPAACVFSECWTEVSGLYLRVCSLSAAISRAFHAV